MSQLLLSALAVVCPACDGYNPPRAGTCALCGAGLAGGAPRTAAPRSSDSVPPGLRPSGRTPPPTAAAGVPVTAARPAPARPPAAAPPAGAVPVTRPQAAGSRFGVAVLAGAARGARFRLPASGCVVGRGRAALALEDPFVSPVHATLLVRDQALYVRDEASASGVFVSVSTPEPLPPQAQFSAGGRLLRFTGALAPQPATPGRPLAYGAPLPPGPAVFGVEELLVGGRPARAAVTAGPVLAVGSGPCELSFPGDEGLAPRHCELALSGAGAVLRDVSGGLGTFVRVAPGTERALRPGDRVRVGGHVLQIEALA